MSSVAHARGFECAVPNGWTADPAHEWGVLMLPPGVDAPRGAEEAIFVVGPLDASLPPGEIANDDLPAAWNDFIGNCFGYHDFVDAAALAVPTGWSSANRDARALAMGAGEVAYAQIWYGMSRRAIAALDAEVAAMGGKGPFPDVTAEEVLEREAASDERRAKSPGTAKSKGLAKPKAARPKRTSFECWTCVRRRSDRQVVVVIYMGKKGEGDHRKATLEAVLRSVV